MLSFLLWIFVWIPLGLGIIFIISILGIMAFCSLIWTLERLGDKFDSLFENISEFKVTETWKKRRLLKSDRLEEMKVEWERQGFISEFSRIHHFSSNNFKSKPLDLLGFYNWCINRDVAEENEQTINRALTVIKLVSSGQTIEKSIKTAWRNHPLVTR